MLGVEWCAIIVLRCALFVVCGLLLFVVRFAGVVCCSCCNCLLVVVCGCALVFVACGVLWIVKSCV